MIYIVISGSPRNTEVDYSVVVTAFVYCGDNCLKQPKQEVGRECVQWQKQRRLLSEVAAH